MTGIAIGLVLSLILLPIGGGILAAVDSISSKRRSPELADSRTAISLFGVILVVVGMLPWIMFLIALGLTLYGVEDIIDLADLLDTLNTLLFLSTVPLAGALLFWIGWLVGHPRSRELETLLDKLLGSVSVIGWLWFILGVLSFAFPIGLVPSALLLMIAFVANQRRAARQSELVWIVMIAAQKKMPLAPGVAAFANECHGPFGRKVHRFANLLISGIELPEAMDRVPGIFPEDVKVAIRVGWESGSLAESLRDIAVRRTTQRPIWHAVAGRLAYLVALLIVLQAVVGFLLYFIVPKFKRIFMDFGVELPQLTLVVLDMSDLVVEYFPLVILPSLNFVVYLLILRCWVVWRPRALSRLMNRPDTARILRALAWNVGAGQPLPAGIDSLARWYPKWAIRYRLACALDGISHGASWSECLVDQGLLRSADAAALTSAERAGNLPWAMRELAEIAERRLGYRLQLGIQIVFPLVVLLFGGMVFFFTAGMLSPLIKLITELSG